MRLLAPVPRALAPRARDARVAASRSRLAAFGVLLVLPLLASCGGGSGPGATEPFVAHFPDEGPGTGSSPPVPIPPPEFPRSPVWTEDAFVLGRTALYGSFPSDLDRLDTTLFVSDADAIEADGARIVPVEIGGSAPVASSRYEVVTLHVEDLVDSAGNPGVLDRPIGFGVFLNDLRVVGPRLGFVLASAGGSDSAPTLSNLVVFDPEAGTVRQVVDLARTVSGVGPLLDSAGARVPGDAFVQSQAEGVEYVPTGWRRGVLFVAMANILFGGPSFGTVKYPGTVQAFDVEEDATHPVTARPAGALSTRTLLTHSYNPVAVTRLTAFAGRERILVTEAGTTAFDASFALVPVTPSAVEAFDAESLDLLGRFDLGLAGLSGIRPAVGTDAVGHAVAYFASSVLGEVFLLRIDGLLEPVVDAGRVAVLRGPSNGIAIDPAAAGGPGGNVAGVALSSDGRTLVVSGFGDLFAFPFPKAGRVLAISLPDDVVSSPDFARSYVPGTSDVVTTSGRTLGPVLIAPFAEDGPEVYVAVGGAVSPTTFLGLGPASVGTLRTFGRIR